MRYLDDLLERKTTVGIWGIGYIGYTTMLHLADCGIGCIGYDPDTSRVAVVNEGRHPVPGLAAWLAIEPDTLVADGRVLASARVQDILRPNVLVHLIAVPTERDGQPWWEPLREVVSSLANYIATSGVSSKYQPLIIIESTLTPGVTDRLILPILAQRGLEIGRDLLLGIAPRRDWFVAPDKTLRTLDRVYCGVDAKSADAVEAVLSVLCNKLHRASNYHVGEMVKCTENAFRHVEIALANQLCLGYPNVDIGEVLALAGTKWNMGLFRPSFGTGGYCIPLAGQYVLEGATNPGLISLLTEAFDSDIRMRWRVAKAVLDRGCRRIGMLGLSYRGDLKVAVMSPAILIAKHLVEGGAEVQMHDPYYSTKEIFEATGVGAFELPHDLGRFDALLVCTDHSRYAAADVRKAVLNRAEDLLILDNFGIWSDWDWPLGAQYYRSGARGWLGVE